MLTRKVLFEAFIIHLIILTSRLLINLLFPRHFGPEENYINYGLIIKQLFNIIIIALLFISLFKEKGSSTSISFILGILTYKLTANGFEWPITNDINNSLKIFSYILYPFMMLLFSFISFKKRQLDLAKAFVFFVVCDFIASSLVQLFIWLGPRDFNPGY